MAAGYAAALAAGGVLFAYTKAFFTSPLHREDPHALPVGEQYINERGRMLALIEELEQIPFEPVTIRSRDGLKLYGRYYHVREGAPVQIQVHGYRGSALRDFCGGSKLAREMGMNILLVDQRAHGGSGGRTITFGIRERWDCLSWAEYAAERFGDVDIYLVGVSMGAASVLMASELDLPENVAGIIADCPFSSPEAIIAKVCREDLHLPQSLAMAFVYAAAAMPGGFGLRAASVVEAVSRTHIPVLLIHGEDDKFVPCGMSREIYAACQSRKTLETFPGAGHGLSYIVDEARYAEAVEKFVKECSASAAGRRERQANLKGACL